MYPIRQIICCLLILFFNSELFAQNEEPTIILTESQSVYEIGKNVGLINDPAHSLTMETAKRGQFTPSGTESINLAFNTDRHFLRFTVKNEARSEKNWLLSLDWNALSQVDFHTPDTVYKTGEHRPFNGRPVAAPSLTFPLKIAPGETKTYYFEIYSEAPNRYPLTIYSEDAFRNHRENDLLLFISYFGAVAIMLIYNFLLFLTIRDRVFIPYLFYMVVSLVFAFSIRGYGYQFLWTDSGWLNGYTRVGFAGLSLFALTAFGRAFLNVKTIAPRYNKFLLGAQIAGLVVAAMMLFQTVTAIYIAADLLLNLSALVIPFMNLAAGIISYRSGFKPAKFYLLAFAFLLIGIIFFVLSNLGVLPHNLIFEYAYLYGVVLEQAILSIALGDRINIAKEEKEKAQAESIAALQANERLIAEQNRMLESKVEERTQQLRFANEELAATLDQVTEQSKIIEAKSNDILESIQYAKRIQTAILPETNFIRQYLPKFGVFYRPKDIVSGDFYWFAHRPEANISLLAAVDCTGHGVPGAFMSVIGYNLLNRIVLEIKETDPARILTELDHQVRTSLHQNDKSRNEKTNDGMDLSLIVLHHDTGLVAYSGAQRPLYWLKNGELEIIKADKFPIGGSQSENKTFTTTELRPAAGDRLYLFTDGIVDQFGGQQGRKFTPKRLQEFILNTRDASVIDLEQTIGEVFDQWIGHFHQIDDVSLMAVEF